MNTNPKPLAVIFLSFALLFLAACGAKEEPKMELSGTIDISMVRDHMDAPLMVLLVKTDDIERLETEADDVIISLISVDKSDLSFKFDLSGKNLKKGESLSIVAFVDVNNTGGTPYPAKGDYIGIYTSEKSTLSLGYKLEGGKNSGIRISINREVFDFDANITGTIDEELTGDLTLIAYAGDFKSSKFSDINVDDVIGYTQINKTSAAPLDYKLKVFPYGKNLPIQNAFVFAVLDVNRNGQADGGDKIGYYSIDSRDLPTALTIDGDMSDIPIGFHMDVNDPSGFPITLKGKIAGPPGFKTSDKPLFIIVMKGDTLDDMMGQPVSSIKYFEKLPPGSTDFTIDISDTDLLPGEAITVAALWDKNFIAGFPKEDPGDMIGFYMDEEALSATYILKEGENTDIDITLNREVFDFDATLKGTVSGTETGDLTLILYTGEFNSSEPDDIDLNKVLGYKKMKKTIAGPIDFEMKVMPYGDNLPIEEAYVIGFLDKNKNGKIDGGDRVGYYSTTENELPTPITVSGNIENITLQFYMDVDYPSGEKVILNGNAILPATYGKESPPLYIIVANGDDLETLLSHPASAIKYFKKLPKGETGFSIDLSSTSLKNGDDIVVIALWDKNFSSGFPNPDKGDLIGFYTNTEKMKAAYSIKSTGNSGITIPVNREIFDFEATVTGTVKGDEEGVLTLIAYNGDIPSSDFSELDFNSIVGYKKISKKTATIDFTMQLLPFGQNLPLKDVFIFAMLDVNKNDEIDGGDRIGYYTLSANNLPSAIDIDSDVSAIDMGFHMTVADPSGHSMILNGNAMMPEGYDETSPPVFVLVAEGNTIDQLMANPADSIKYFRKLAPGESAFSIDLSKTDLTPGEEIMIVTLWDLNFKNGFPNPDPGDMIGYYINTKRFAATFRPMAGSNNDIFVDVNRKIYDFDAKVTGTVQGDEEGDLTLIAYTGEFTSSDFSSLDFNEISGYATFEKGKESLDYSMKILPYGKDLPIENAYILALLDVNRNGLIDEGDRIGYYSKTENGLPTPLTIDGDMENIDLRFFMTVHDPSGYSIFLTGTLGIDASYGKNSSPAFIIVADGDNMESLMRSPASQIRYFEKLPKGQRSFDLDLSNTNLKPGEKVMIIALYDRNYKGGFPNPDKGDMIGFYLDAEKLSATYTVPPANDIDTIQMNTTISVNREIFDFDAKIEGTVFGSDKGILTLIAYAGNLESSDFSKIDTNAIIGFKKMEKGAESQPYSMQILPYGKDVPITNLFILALLDKNRNGIIDGQDKIGYYSQKGKSLPLGITLPKSDEAVLLKNIDINFYMTIEESAGYDMSISGSFSMKNGQNTATQPVFIMLAKNGDMDQMLKNPASVIKYFEKIPAGQTVFNIDLKKTSLKPQDEIMIIALWDKNYQGGFPNPDAGDYIGFYIDSQKLSTGYTLKNGNNTGITIAINREVFDFEATLSGRVNGDLSGDLTLIAYTGELSSSDFSDIDFNQVRGYVHMAKGSGSVEYQMTILPYGGNLPITNVFLLALLDVNRNGVNDEGDRIGYYSREENGLPTGFTINGSLTNMDINFKMTVPKPSGLDMRLSGRLTLPPAYYNGSGSGPAYILIAKSDTLESLMADPASSIKYFKKLDPGADTFSVDLSGTDLLPGDEIMIIGLWDRNYQGGFPNPDRGDMIGFYTDPEKLEPGYELKYGENSGIHITVNREIFDFDASVSGTVRGTETGILTLVAYTGDVTSSDFSDLDMDQVCGYGKTVKDSGADLPYRIDILPYGKDLPIKNAFIFGLMDINQNGKSDAGDKIGFYENPSTGLPKGMTINGHENNIDLSFSMTIPEPSGFHISLKGNVTPPSAYYQSGSPLFIIVAKGDSIDEMMTDPMSSILYFEKLPQGATAFDIDLSKTSLVPGDEIMIIGLWDRNYQGGFPNPDKGDMIGFYMDTEKMSPAYILSDGPNTGIAITVNREIFDFEASVSGTVLGTDTGILTLIAYTGDFTSSDFSDIDIDQVSGYAKTVKDSEADLPYRIDILPYGKDIPINNAFIFGLMDVNQNGKSDAGDKIGFYEDPSNGLPKGITIDGHESNVDLSFSMTIPEPSGFHMSLRGNVTPPSAYYQSSSPLFIIVAKGDSIDEMMTDPMASILYFERLPKGETGFDIDLSKTSLVPGDEIMIIGLWDRNYHGGFPNPDKGDLIGFYVNKEKMSPTHLLYDGPNTGINFSISREVFDFKASVSGTVSVNGTGDLILIAYADEPDLQNIFDIDFDDIAGYMKIKNSAGGQIDYTLNILPYGQDLPFDVYVFGVLDRNKNGQVDKGDKVGYYTRSIFGLPSAVTIPDSGEEMTEVTGIDLNLKRTMYDYDTSVSFKIDPKGRPSNLSDGTSLIALVIHEDGLMPFVNLPVNADYVIGYSKLPFNSDPDHEYRFDILDFIYEGIDYSPSMNVAVYVFYDRDNDGMPSFEDTIAMYWKEFCVNFPIHFCTRQPMLWPLERDSENFLKDANNDPSNNPYGVKFLDLSFQTLIGNLSSAASRTAMAAFSYGQSFFSPNEETLLSLLGFDINNLPQIETVSDTSSNMGEEGGAGESSPEGFEEVPAEEDSGLYNSAAKLLEGEIVLPEEIPGSEASALFIMILQPFTLDQLILHFNDLVTYFKMIPEGTTGFTIDIEEIGLEPGDEAIIFALWDQNDNGLPDMGDLMGFYQTGSDMISPFIVNGENMNTIEILINRSFIDVMTLFVNGQ